MLHLRRVEMPFTPEQEAFRAEARALARPRASPGSSRPLVGRGGPGDEHEVLRGAPRVGAQDGTGRLDVPVLAEGARRPGREPRRAGDLPRGVRAGARARDASATSAKGSSGRRSSSSGPSAQKQRLPPAHRPRRPRCGARDTPSRTPGATWRTCRRARSATATSGSSPGRRFWTSHAQWADWCFVLCRTDAERAASTRASRTCSCRCASRASKCDPSGSLPGRRSSTRCSSTARARRPTTSSAR